MGVYTLMTVQKIPVSLDEAWDFFSHPKNLSQITPPELNLKFTNELFGDQMYPGQVITYRVKPLAGIPLSWMTEITHVSDKVFFVDEQRAGPYALWHHQHHFTEIPGGVEMTDLIHYRIPLGFLGAFAHWLFIRRKLEQIFSYRTEMINKIFGTWPAANRKEYSLRLEPEISATVR